jgi:hypothetical protein
MRPSIRPAPLILTATVLAAGCRKEDPRVTNLGVGIPKDSAMVVMELETAQRPSSWLVNGQYIETFEVRYPGVEGPRDSVSRKQITPLVLIDGKVAGWGWKFWDSVGQANGIPTGK